MTILDFSAIEGGKQPVSFSGGEKKHRAENAVRFKTLEAIDRYHSIRNSLGYFTKTTAHIRKKVRIVTTQLEKVNSFRNRRTNCKKTVLVNFFYSFYIAYTLSIFEGLGLTPRSTFERAIDFIKFLLHRFKKVQLTVVSYFKDPFSESGLRFPCFRQFIVRN